MTKGRFITFEGGEGAGKSTQAARLAAALGQAGFRTVETREPGGSPGAEQIRELLVRGEVARWEPLTEALLHFAARREHLSRTVLPALESGAWVVCDRFADSTMAYQGYGQGLGRGPVEMLYRLAVGELSPDLTLILDLPVAEGLRRAAQRSDGGAQRYERMGPAFHERLRAGFLEIARLEPARCAVIDAGPGPDEVHAAVRRALLERLEVELP